MSEAAVLTRRPATAAATGSILIIDDEMAIRESLAATMGLAVEHVSVKFKTAERVGPVGEGRSAEAQAVVCLVRSV